MTTKGIYTLANDVVYDQLVALLNSIEQNVSRDIPICVIPFDERLDLVKKEIETRPQVSLFQEKEAIEKWENFAQEVWEEYPKYQKQLLSRPAWGKGHHRKFVAFEGAFEQFVYYDGDSLAMKPLDSLFAKLNDYDLVFDDWEHRKPLDKAALDISSIVKSGHYKLAEVQSHLHCSSFFASKKGLFNQQELDSLKELLTKQEEVAWLPRWWDDAFLFNYLTLRSGCSAYNFTQSLDSQDRTGNCADSDPFINIDNVLYNEQGLKPIHRLHYMNYPAIDFTRLTQGEDVNIRYKDIFLHYRFLKQPELKPQVLTPPNSWVRFNRKVDNVVGKIKKLFVK